jgi:hypothetical protein
MKPHWLLSLACVSTFALAACGDGGEGRVDDVDRNPLEAKDSEEDFNDGLAGALGDEENPVALDTEVAEEDGQRLDAALVTLSEVRLPSDVDALVDNSFERADTDDDGMLTGEEYLIIAPALGQSDNNIGRPDGDEPGGTAVGTADTGGETGLPDGWVAAGRDDFIADITNGGMDVTREDMRSALRARFEAADEDSNDVLENDEIVAFGRLAMAIRT